MRKLVGQAVIGAATCALGVAGVPAASGPSGQAVAMLDRIPTATLRQMTDPSKAIGYPKLAWAGQTVTVAFNGGDPMLYALIEATASEWTAHGGRMHFSFKRNDGTYRTWSEADTAAKADIRIGFFRDKARDGYWSVVGVLARNVRPSEETMNLGDLGTTISQYYDGANPSGWRQSYAHEVILHEFGHALSLNHEHFHPQCQADLNLQKAVDYLMGPSNGWSRQQAMFNMDAKTYFDAMKAQAPGQAVSTKPKIDQASVMLYSFADNFYKSGAVSPCRPSVPLGYATNLSAEDQIYYASLYG